MGNTLYFVAGIVRNLGGTLNRELCKLTTTASTGIEKESIASAIPFAVYPNPNSGSFTLELSDMQNVGLSLINVLGEVVYAEQVIVKKEISIKGVPAGIYFLNLQSGNEVYHSKIVVE